MADVEEIIAQALRRAGSDTPFSHAPIVLSALKEAGYAVVPVEPTQKMIARGRRKILGGSTFDDEERREMAAEIYRAMLRASQEG